MANLKLRLGGDAFDVRKQHLSDFLDTHPKHYGDTEYSVKSPVPIGIFRLFVDFVTTGTHIPITPETVTYASLLAAEFHRQDLIDECAKFVQTLSARVADLERRLSAQTPSSDRLDTMEEEIESLSRQVAALRAHSVQNDQLRSEIDQLRVDHRQAIESLSEQVAALRAHSVQNDQLRSEIDQLKADHRQEIAALRAELSAANANSNRVVCEFSRSSPLDGIIAHLTRRFGGNVHDRDVVLITSKSTYSKVPGGATACPAKNLADLSVSSRFSSTDNPGEFVTWDFRQSRVKPTHYTIRNTAGESHLRSWILEGSLDGAAWTQMDRQADNQALRAAGAVASFAVQRSVECRFVRLTQTGKNHRGRDYLVLEAFELFGEVAIAPSP